MRRIILLTVTALVSCTDPAAAQGYMVPPTSEYWPHWGVERHWPGGRMLMPQGPLPMPYSAPRGPLYDGGQWRRGGGYPYSYGGGCVGNVRCGYYGVR